MHNYKKDLRKIFDPKMYSDLQTTENFIRAYFNSEKCLVLHKIYLISNRNTKSRKYFTFLKDNLKKLIKNRIRNISTIEIFKEHKWFLDMVNIFSKIFRDTKRMHIIEKIVKSKFKDKLLILKNEIIMKASEDFFIKNYSETMQFTVLNDFYNLNFKEEVENEIIKKYVEDVKDSEISELSLLINNINDQVFNITDRLLNQICGNIDDYKISRCLLNKENLPFLNKLYAQNTDKYREIITNYIVEKYDIYSKDSTVSDESYVNNILYMYNEYKEFDEFVKSVFYCTFKNMNIQYEKVVNVINKGQKFKDLYEFSGFLYNFITEKDIYERNLRKCLCLRLINSISTVEEEEEILKLYKMHAKDIYVYKMNDVIEDYKKRIIFNNTEIMMMRKFQWVEFKNQKVEIEELDQVKSKYEEQIAKYERKKIVWMDSLSTVETEINGKNFLLSLIQYEILMKIDDIEYINDLKSDYKKNLDKMIEKGLVIKTETEYIIQCGA